MSPHPRLPVVVLSGLARADLELAESAALFTFPEPVLLRHEIDVEEGHLTRVVADGTGVIEHRRIQLDHTCLTCALRYEIVPTLVRLSEEQRWGTALLSLPVGAEPLPLVRAAQQMTVAGRLAAERLDVRSVMTALTGADLLDHIFGDTLMRERDESLHAGDARAVGEVLAQQLEYADVVAVVDGRLASVERAVLSELRCPGSVVVTDLSDLAAEHLVDRTRDDSVADAWVSPTGRRPASGMSSPDRAVEATLPDSGPGVWTVFIDTWRPFHPRRLMASLEDIGGHGYRGRGCFWLPTRPDAVAVWDGGGGQLSVGTSGTWNGQQPCTRIVVTGIDDRAAEVARAIDEALLTDAELAGGIARFLGTDDGFDAWLGSYSEIA